MSTNFSFGTVPQPAAQYNQPVVVGDKYVNASADALIKTGDGWLAGIHVNSTTSGTVKIYDNTSAAGTVMINTFTPSLGWNPMPIHFNTGCYVDMGGTLDYTVVYS